MSNEKDQEHFIFFGCWNNGGCTIGNCNKDKKRSSSSKRLISKEIETINPLSGMMQQLIKRTETESESEPSFMIVAGDNYYPNIINETIDGVKIKSKKFKQEDLESGFCCLDNINIETKFILLGNHDVDGFSGDSEIVCPILQFQKDKYLNDPASVLFNFHSKQLMTHKIKDHTIIIMFDSTVYDSEKIKKDKDGNFLKCYNLISPESQFSSIDEIEGSIRSNIL